MEANQKFGIIIATVLFLTLFTHTMFPPPLNKITDIMSEVGFVGYRMMETLGVITDYRICTLLDVWNYGGMTAEVYVWDSSPEIYENYSCAELSEKNISIGRFQEETLGEGLYGTAEKFYIQSKRQVNKVFYSFYIFFGLMLMGVMGDIFISFAQFRATTTQSIAMGGTASVATTLLLMRSSALWDGLSLVISITPGGGGPAASMILALLMLGPIWFLVTQFFIGYRIGKKGIVDPFKAIETAVGAEVKKGQAGLDIIRK